MIHFLFSENVIHVLCYYYICEKFIKFFTIYIILETCSAIQNPSIEN